MSYLLGCSLVLPPWLFPCLTSSSLFPCLTSSSSAVPQLPSQLQYLRLEGNPVQDDPTWPDTRARIIVSLRGLEELDGVRVRSGDRRGARERLGLPAGEADDSETSDSETESDTQGGGEGGVDVSGLDFAADSAEAARRAVSDALEGYERMRGALALADEEMSGMSAMKEALAHLEVSKPP